MIKNKDLTLRKLLKPLTAPKISQGTKRKGHKFICTNCMNMSVCGEERGNVMFSYSLTVLLNCVNS